MLTAGVLCDLKIDSEDCWPHIFFPRAFEEIFDNFSCFFKCKNIKMKSMMRKIMFNYWLYRLSPLASCRHRAKMWKKLAPYQIVLVENQKELPLSLQNVCKIKNVHLNIREEESGNNQIKIHLPQNGVLFLSIWFKRKNNQILIGQNVSGDYQITMAGMNNVCSIGENTKCFAPACRITLIDNILKIGKDCLLSNSVCIWGDGHSVLDLETKKVLNKSSSPILIGDHCWIGERVTLTKNAQIAEDTIVGIASIVTKSFKEKHTVLAGCPAKVVKTGVTWDEKSPMDYIKDASSKK